MLCQLKSGNRRVQFIWIYGGVLRTARIPSFGSLVKVTTPAVEILVSSANQAQPASNRAGIRSPAVRWKIRRGRYQSSPQLMKLLRSEFQVWLSDINWMENISISAAQAAHIHAFVYVCGPRKQSYSVGPLISQHTVNNRLQISSEERLPHLREWVKHKLIPTFLVAVEKLWRLFSAVNIIVSRQFWRG